MLAAGAWLLVDRYTMHLLFMGCWTYGIAFWGLSN
jgi:hypothetical protein